MHDVAEDELRASIRSEQRAEKALTLYRDGASVAAIARRLDLSQSAVRGYLRAAGIAPRKYCKRDDAA